MTKIKIFCLCHQENFEMKNWKKSFLKFENNLTIPLEGNEKN
jgi:hypothetical protein